MEAVTADYAFNGAVVVTRSGETLYEGAWGLADREAGVPFTIDTPVDGASLAKTFVAAGIWQLHEEGVLSVDESVSRYVPEVPDTALTIRHLLTHSAGIADLEDPTGLTNEAIARAIAPAPMFQPGTRMRYCNECFDILALVTERVTNEPWPDFLASRFFQPFGLDSAFVRPARFEDWAGSRTRSYRVSEEGDVVLHDVFDNEPFYGSSNIYLSARDLQRWGHAVMTGAALPDGETGRQVLGRPLFSEGGCSALNYLNWYQPETGGPAYFDGHLRGFHHVVYWDPRSELVVVWVSNVLGGRPQELEFTRALVRVAEGGQPKGVPRFEHGVDLASTPPEQFTGTYDVDGLGRVAIEWLDGIISMRLDGAPATMGTRPTASIPRIWESRSASGIFVMGATKRFTGLRCSRALPAPA